MRYKIRPICANSKYGNYYGLTVPEEAVKKFGEETRFEIIIQKTRIIFKSGAEHSVR